MDFSTEQKLIFNTEEVGIFIRRISESISAEFNGDRMDSVAFIGLQQNGVPLARRIARQLREIRSCDPPIGTLDISMYRDDIGMRKTLPLIHETLIPFDINGKILVLTDGVLQTGRSIRAALDAITDFGRPALIRLAVLIDRGLREFPIRADYVGEMISLPREERVKVSWAEYTGSDAVYSVPGTNDANGMTR